MSKDTNNSGAFFKNKDKKTDKHPDYRGSAIVDEKRYWVSVWVNKSQKGETYFSTAYTLKDNQDDVPHKSDKPNNNNSPEPEFDDDLPF